MTDSTWTNGGGDGKASTAANWSAGIDVGHNLIFDATSTANCAFDYSGQLGTFTIGSGYSGTVTQSSDMYISGYSQAGGTFTGITTKCDYCSGNFLKTAGTFTDYVAILELCGNTNSLTTNTAINFFYLKISGNTTLLSSIFLNAALPNWGLEVTETGILNITSSKIVYYILYTDTNDIINKGSIIGAGQIMFQFKNNHDITLNNIFCNIRILNTGTADQLATLTLNGNIGTILIDSNHATYTCTLDLNGHSLTASSITVGTRGILQCGEGTITTSSLDSSAGTITEETATWITTGGGTIKTNGTDEIYNYTALGSDTLGSNLVVSNEYVRFTEPKLAGFAITHNAPEKFYSGGKTKYTRGYVRGYLKTGKNRAINRFLERNTR